MKDRPMADVPAPAFARTLELPVGRIEPAWMIAPRSHLVDMYVPDCEEIRLPARSFGGGVLTLRLEEAVCTPQDAGRRTVLRNRLLPVRKAPDARIMMDLRRRAPVNWAHMLTNHLPLVFAASREAGVPLSDLLLLLPSRTPGHILAAASLFGLAVHACDDALKGRALVYDAAPWTGIRAARAGWVRDSRVAGRLDAAGVRAAGDGSKARVFLSRKDTRRLENEAEIAAHLSERGFRTVYAEDLPVVEQFSLLEQAEEIVAVHGAALAPLLYRSEAAPPPRLVELFPAGKVTNVWRAVTAQLGGRWVGVRGRLRPEHLAPAYDLSQPYERDSLQDFDVDPASMVRALERLDDD